jgi:hypothetical protein
MYLNKAGKRQLAMKIAKVVMEVTEVKVNNTIYLDWKHVTEKTPIARVNNMLQNDPNIRKSTRSKKSSKDMKQDFYAANEFSNNGYKNKYDL